MKKIFALVSSALLLTTNLVAGQYVSLGIGPDVPETTSSYIKNQKIGGIYSAAYGYQLGDKIYAEVEATYRSRQNKTIYVDNGKDNITSKRYNSVYGWGYMANVKYFLPQLEYDGLVPFAGAGIGWATNTIKDKIKYDSDQAVEKIKDSRFAWQILAGFKYALDDSYDVLTQYQYFNGESHIKNHSVNIILRKNF